MADIDVNQLTDQQALALQAALGQRIRMQTADGAQGPQQRPGPVAAEPQTPVQNAGPSNLAGAAPAAPAVNLHGTLNTGLGVGAFVTRLMELMPQASPEAMRAAAALLNMVSPSGGPGSGPGQVPAPVVENQVGSSGHGQAGKSRIPPRVWDDSCTGRRKVASFFYDIHKYAQKVSEPPVDVLTQSLAGQVRDNWQTIFDSNKSMTWDQAQIAFAKLVGDDLVDTRKASAEALIALPVSSHQNPKESVTSYSLRFRSHAANVGSAIAESTLVQLYMQGLLPT